MSTIADQLNKDVVDKLKALKELLPEKSDQYKKLIKEAETIILDSGLKGFHFRYDNGLLYQIFYKNVMYKPVLVKSQIYIKRNEKILPITDFIANAKAGAYICV